MTRPRALWAIVPSLLLVCATTRADVVERVVVKVNGRILTLSEFESRQITAVQAARIAPDQVETFLQQNNAKILQDAVDELLLVQRADELGIRMRPEYIDQVIEDIKSENGIQTDAQLQEQLRREGMLLSDLRRNIERSVLRRQVLSQELEPRAAVSEAEVVTAYQARRASDYTKPATVHLQEIVVSGADAEQRSGQLAQRARAGEDFAELAQAHSQAGTAAAGGDLGQVPRADLSPTVAAVVADLAAGQVSAPLAMDNGEYRILRVVEKRDATIVPFEEIKADLRRQLGQQRFAEEYEKYMKNLRDGADVDYRVREVSVDVDASTPQLAEPGSAETPSEESGADAPEFEGLAPGGGPERVAPPVLPGEEAPTPEPTPTPEP